jgi:hypothetical protein
MKFYLSAVTVICFSFSAFSAANIHTLVDIKMQNERNAMLASALVKMPARALGEIDI